MRDSAVLVDEKKRCLESHLKIIIVSLYFKMQQIPSSWTLFSVAVRLVPCFLEC